MSKENREKLKKRIDQVLENKHTELDKAYTKSLEELVEELKSYQIELEFQNEELQKAHLELTNSRNAYQELFQGAPVGYLILDDSFRIQQFNKTFAAYFDSQSKPVNGMDFRKLIHPHAQDNFHSFIRQLHDNRKPNNTELVFRHQQLQKLHFSVNGNIEFRNEKPHYRLTLLNISDQIKAQESDKKAAEQFKTLFTDSPVPQFIHDKQTGEILYVNKKALSTNGCSTMEEFEKGHFWLPTPYSRQDAAERIKQAEIGKESSPYEWKSQKPDGSIFWEEIRQNSILINGKEHIIATAFDITERKQAEEQLKEHSEMIQLLLNSTAEAIFGINIAGQCAFVNKSCLNMLAYENENVLLGLNIHEVIHHTQPDGQKHELEDCRLYQSFKNGEKLHADDEYFWRADGSSFPVEYWSYPIMRQGKPIGAVVTFLDITDRKKWETELLTLNKNLTETNQTKDKLFSILSHDLRTPVAAVLGLSTILAESIHTFEQHEIKKIASSIQASSANLSELIDNLLEWSLIQKGSYQPAFQYQLVTELIENTVLSLNHMAVSKNISVQMEVPENLAAYYDRQMMGSAIQNLLSNAIKFTQRGGEVQIKAAQKNDDAFYIQIRDNGIGIPEKMAENIFGMDDIKNRPGTENERSSGLGLIICKEFIDVHKGHITVNSKVDEGSVFTISLPIYQSGQSKSS